MIRVGTAGWSYADWQGPVYPRRKPRGFHPLAYLAKYVDCVEINSSFYAQPNPEHAELWVRLVEPHPEFRFTAKLLRDFTHAAWGSEATMRAASQRFLAGLEPLSSAARLACVLVQFPHSFRRSEGAEQRLERIDELFAGVPLVYELRHASWFEDESCDAGEVVRASARTLAHVDMPHGSDQAPRDFESRSRLGYVRLHGRNSATWFDPRAGRDQRYDYLYSPTETDELVERVRRVAAHQAETFVIANNHFAGQAVVNALELLAQLRATPPLAPTTLTDAYPRLRECTRSDGQARLF